MKAVLTVVLVVLVGLGAAAEVMAPRLVEDRVEQRAEENARGAAGVEADAGSFPFVPRLLANTEVRSLAVTLTEVAGAEVTFAEITYELQGIHLDRDKLFEGEAEVTDIDTGVFTATVTEETLGAVGEVAPGDVEVDGRTLSLGPADLSPAQVVVPERLLPCEPQAETTDEGLRLTCVFHEVPQVLVRAAA
jgi:hypothetical protein